MSLILRGIDMPKEKDEALVLLILGDGTVAEKIGSDRYEEMTDTQAIQIPTPHGRLIDANKLEAMMYHEAFEIDSDMQKWDSGCWIRYKVFENCMNRLLPSTIIEPEE